MGVRKGTVVGIMLPNLPQTVIAYYAAMRIGAVLTPINPLYVEAEIAQQIEDSGCEVIVALDQFAARLIPLVGRTPLRRIIVTAVPVANPASATLGEHKERADYVIFTKAPSR